MLIRQGLSGRVQPILGQYLAHPSHCAMCTRTPHTPEEYFLNLNVELDYFGFMYLCPDCAVEIGESVSSVPYERFQELEEHAAAMSVLIVENTNQIAYLKGLLDARIDLARSGVPNSDESVSVPVLEVESESDDVDSLIDGLEPEPVKSGKD
jgi:hypothetical protein